MAKSVGSKFAVRIQSRVTAGTLLDSAAGEQAATFNSKGVKMGPYETFSYFVYLSAETGTPDWTITFERSETSTDGVDGQWAQCVFQDGNAAAAANMDMAQITATGTNVSVDYPIGVSDQGWIRAVHTLASTTGSTFNEVYWALSGSR